MRAAIYARLSHDPDGTSTAVARQRADCEGLIGARGWELAEVFEDNDISAYNKRARRPAFELLISALREGRIDAVVVYRSDRLARQPRDLERFIDAAEGRKAQLVSVTEPQFEGAAGLMILRLLVNLANHESAVKGERQARRNRHYAEEGQPWRSGIRTFGRTKEYELHPVEAPLVREAFDRTLAGESTSAIVADWRQRGIPTVSGGEWRRSNFTRMLRAPSHAGLRSYQGRLIDGCWEPIVSRERWQQAVAVLDGRPKSTGPLGRKHMLTGLAHCGDCGAPMVGVSRGARRGAEYRCRQEGGCGRVSMNLEALDAIVTERFLHVASTPSFAALVAGAQEGQGEVQRLLAGLREDEAALEQLTKDHYVERAITRPAFMAAKDALDARIAAARQAVARQASPVLTAPVGDAEALRAEWGSRGAAWRRSVLEAAVRRVVVAPAPKGPGSRGPDWLSRRVTVEWLV